MALVRVCLPEPQLQLPNRLPCIRGHFEDERVPLKFGSVPARFRDESKKRPALAGTGPAEGNPCCRTRPRRTTSSE